MLAHAAAMAALTHPRSELEIRLDAEPRRRPEPTPEELAERKRRSDEHHAAYLARKAERERLQYERDKTVIEAAKAKRERRRLRNLKIERRNTAAQ